VTSHPWLVLSLKQHGTDKPGKRDAAPGAAGALGAASDKYGETGRGVIGNYQWQLVVPLSVNVLPAWGTNCQS
jgi:hypothetical protein